MSFVFQTPLHYPNLLRQPIQLVHLHHPLSQEGQQVVDPVGSIEPEALLDESKKIAEGSFDAIILCVSSKDCGIPRGSSLHRG